MEKYNRLRKILIFWTLFIGIGAVVGSLMMLINPSGNATGMSGMLPYFQVLPFADKLFQNFIFSGIMLLIVNGITNLLAAALLFAKKKSGIILDMIFGITLMLWIVIQFVIFPFNFMSTAYFIFGFLQFVTGYACFVRYKQSQFKFDEKEYQDIGKDKTKIVVYFSRLGYTKKLAYEIANEKRAEIFEIKTTEKITGNLGFWWCGRFGMHKWGMSIESTKVDFSKYDEVVICSPIWVFGLSAPVREFCKQNSGKVKNVSYHLTHFMSCKFTNAATEMDNLLQVNHASFSSYISRFGNVRKMR